MTLRSFFSVIAGILLGIIVLDVTVDGCLAYWSNRERQRDQLAFAAQGLAVLLDWKLRELEKAVQTIAEQNRIISLMERGDPNEILGEAEQLSASVPESLRIRLLQPSIQMPDTTVMPQMGYADLRMVREAMEKYPEPAVHEFTTPNNHLAIARRIVAGDRVVGVVLASISTEPVLRLIKLFPVSGTIELKQGLLRLGWTGQSAPENSDPAASVAVKGAAWTLNYWLPEESGLGFLELFLAGLISLGLGSILMIVAYRRFKLDLTADLNTIMEFTKALMAGKVHGNYPVHIREFELVVKQLAQSKPKQINLEKNPANAKSDSEEFRIKGASMIQDRPSLAKKAKLAESEAGIEVESHSFLSPTIFRAYDIRGILNDTLNEEVVGLIGRALGSEALDAGQESVIIARDGRLSSPLLADALAQGLRSTGCDVIDLGLAPTPVLYFATHYLNSRSGVMITGSHNPPNYNGLKMVIDGETLSGARIQELHGRIEHSRFRAGNGSLQRQNLASDYLATILDDVQLGGPIKIVVDCGNGVAGELAPSLLRGLGCEVMELFCEVDGNFPNHHPDPSKPENLRDLIAAVKGHGAALGIAFDGDGDRLGIVDCAGKIIWPDRLLMLFAADVLSRQPGADIIFDVKCSRNLSREIVKAGGRPLMWKTGHSLIKAKMRETGAMLAGEMSGHIFFKERWFGFDDALYAAARLIEIVSTDHRPSNEVFADFPDSINTPEMNVWLDEGENFAFIEKLLKAKPFPDAKITDIDGLRADYPEGWGLVRASNTTPSLVIRFEANDQHALESIQAQFRAALTRVKPDIQLPF